MIKKLNNILRKNSKILESAIAKVLCAGVDKNYRNIVKYQITTGGKRIRPALAIICCKLLGGKIKDVIYPAAGLEILHNYSMIIDDIIDSGVLRRNKLTAQAKFGKSVAQCIAIDYFASVFQAANLSKNGAKISDLLSEAIKILTEGEILDILFEQRGRENESYVFKNRCLDIDIKKYSEMISKKTAVLFKVSCQAGAICAGASQKQLKAVGDFGFNLGMAFQVRDDILDIFGNEAKFGKKIGKDIEERKGGNIVILLASREFSHKEKSNFWKILRKEKIYQKDINIAIKLIKKTRAKEKAAALCSSFAKKAKDKLTLLPKSAWNEALKQAADFVIIREK